MSKSYYIGRLIIGGVVLSIVAAFDSLALMLVVGLYLLFVYIKFHREMWGSIQDEYARTTPGRAAWFLLIPIFDLYWYFVVYPGFVTDYNRYVQRRSYGAERISLFPFMAYAVLNVVRECLGYGYYAAVFITHFLMRNHGGLSHKVLGMILRASSLYYILPLNIIFIVLFLVIIWKVCDAVDALPGPSPRPRTVPVGREAADEAENPIGDR